MPDPVKIRDSASRARLVEFLVDKRVKSLEYLRLLHTRDDQLWMNTVRMGKTEIGRYFGVDEDVLDPHGRLRSARNKVVIRHQRTASQQCASPVSFSSAASPVVVETNVSVTLQAVDGLAQGVGAQWLQDNLPKLFTLGLALADLLLVPLGGLEFIDYLYQLILEMDVAYASGGTARVLATRALRNHRAALHSDPNAAAADSSAQQEAGAAGSSKLCIVSEAHLHPPFLPGYDIVVPALCTTLIFAYRKMCDYEAVENEDAVKQVVVIDRRLKSIFFGSISKELGKLARAKVLQQTALLSESIFAAFSNADDSLVNELLKMRAENAARPEPGAKQEDSRAGQQQRQSIDTDDD
jgi:hypothetical protein